ncbi:amidohydrolase family protein [Sandarakinorhabdus sp.]|uniref:Xaa-Pro dipeptidase n=1 Tax=Sandarakinorhabdus sp. TaxID=1916663 RepID=UPI00286EACC2|nr:amidohydrolase family protein [Sandarakinorhabdus sp.]
MFLRGFLALCLAGAAIPAAADTLAVTAARMLDVETGRVIDNPRIVITDGRITAAGPAATTPAPAGARGLDLAGLTLLPGLIDMHVHLSSDPRLGGDRALRFVRSFQAVMGVAHAKVTIEAGFTTVRNVGSDGFDDLALKQGIENGYIPGPRIVPATYAIGATGGHCDTNQYPAEFEFARPGIADGPDAIRSKVRELHRRGAEVIKFCATGGVFSAGTSVGAQQYTQAEMDALVAEAHMLGMKVAAHAHGTSGINTALRAGVDTIEHASFADATSFELAKKSGAWFSMDIYDDDYILAEGARNGVPEENLAKEREVGLKQRQNFQAAHKAGVKMVFGTDAGVYPHGDNALQFAKLVEWGMTPLQAIQTATVNAGQALGKAGDVGSLSPGHFGDIIAVAGDPLGDVTVLRKIAVVIKDGQIVKDAR